MRHIVNNSFFSKTDPVSCYPALKKLLSEPIEKSFGSVS